MYHGKDPAARNTGIRCGTGVPDITELAGWVADHRGLQPTFRDSGPMYRLPPNLSLA